MFITRECPSCKAGIRPDASVCPHCQQESEPWTWNDHVWWKKDESEEWAQASEPVVVVKDGWTSNKTVIVIVAVIAVISISGVLGGANKPADKPAHCISFASANDQVFNFAGDPSGVEIAESPVGDHATIYAIRVDGAVWITTVPPDGSDGGLTLAVNDAAETYDRNLGAGVNVEDSLFADLAAGAEAASAPCT